jgi:hypothetical protein
MKPKPHGDMKTGEQKNQALQSSSWIVEELASIHSALPAYFCTDGKRFYPLPITEQGKMRMVEEGYSRLVSDGDIDYDVLAALYEIYEDYSERLLYPIWAPVWTFSTLRNVMKDKSSALSQALLAAYGKETQTTE